jgi:hypothetical protein
MSATSPVQCRLIRDRIAKKDRALQTPGKGRAASVVHQGRIDRHEGEDNDGALASHGIRRSALPVSVRAVPPRAKARATWHHGIMAGPVVPRGAAFGDQRVRAIVPASGAARRSRRARATCHLASRRREGPVAARRSFWRSARRARTSPRQSHGRPSPRSYFDTGESTASLGRRGPSSSLRFGMSHLLACFLDVRHPTDAGPSGIASRLPCGDS